MSLFTFVSSERISTEFALLKYLFSCLPLFRRCQFAAGRHNELRQIENRINSHSLLVCIFTGHFITVFLSHDFDSKNITSDRMDGIVQCQFNIYLFVTSKLFFLHAVYLWITDQRWQGWKKNKYFRRRISIH